MNPILDTKDFRPSSVHPAQGTPLVLKRGGLESSDQKLTTSFGKTKRIAFFSGPYLLVNE